MCLTKLDILDTFEEIKIGVGYKVDGVPLLSMPGMRLHVMCTLTSFYTSGLSAYKTYAPPLADQFTLEKVQVDYISLPGWKSSITHVKCFDDLPSNTKTYIKKLEELMGIPSERAINVHSWRMLT